MKTKTIFLALFFTLVAAFNLVVGAVMVDFFSPLSLVSFLIIQLINILVAYRLSEYLLSLLVPRIDLPRLETLGELPLVAVLYLTYNDALRESMDRLGAQTYRNYDVFVLDDSTDPACRQIVDGYGYTVLRRPDRKGFKAGAINHWLRRHGDDYTYFIILDSDSKLSDDFVERMVKYAEHPANRRVAIFQSKWRIWNTGNRFPRLIAAQLPLWLYSFEKLANLYDMPLIIGHNNLLRTGPIREAGGMDEKTVCEDLATSVNVLEKGYLCKYVDVIAYESCPENLSSYRARYVRWGKGTLQIAMGGTRNISFMENLQLFMTAYSYLIYLVYIPGMVLATWSFHSSLFDASYIAGLIGSGRIVHTDLFLPFLIILAYVTIFILIKIPLAICMKMRMRDYFIGILLNPAVDFYMLVPLVRGLIGTLLGRKVSFNVTDKRARNVTFLGTLREMSLGLCLWALLVLGIAYNPVSFVFNAFWMTPFLLAPLTLYLAQAGGGVPSDTADAKAHSSRT